MQLFDDHALVTAELTIGPDPGDDPGLVAPEPLELKGVELDLLGAIEHAVR